ncbi:MAG: DNA polymerase III subunit delta [Epulopiscium sp. Nuni2H_MBin003]|nr:MAG: DNA polymerase III subunit delta [Epulopiscium sp. Nuni2H_MBin003]
MYLLYGNETWIKNKRVEELKGTTTEQMNLSMFEGKNCDVSAIIDTGETLPFFSDTKCIIVKDSGLFAAGRKEQTDKLSSWLDNFPEYLVLIFSETNVDKRNKLYKKINKLGKVESCDYPNDIEVRKIINQLYPNPKIETSMFEYFYHRMPQDINYILNEYKKLLSYCGDNPITIEAIEMACSISIEKRVFDLTRAMSRKDSQEALSIYYNLIELKESPIGILVLIAREYRLILQIKYLSRSNATINQIAKEVGLPLFVVKEIISIGKQFKFSQLLEIINLCREVDKDIKTGKMDAVQSIETLIVRCIHLC